MTGNRRGRISSDWSIEKRKPSLDRSCSKWSCTRGTRKSCGSSTPCAATTTTDLAPSLCCSNCRQTSNVTSVWSKGTNNFQRCGSNNRRKEFLHKCQNWQRSSVSLCITEVNLGQSRWKVWRKQQFKRWDGMWLIGIRCRSSKSSQFNSLRSTYNSERWPGSSFSWRCRLTTWPRCERWRLICTKSGDRRSYQRLNSRWRRLAPRWTWTERPASLDSFVTLFY